MNLIVPLKRAFQIRVCVCERERGGFGRCDKLFIMLTVSEVHQGSWVGDGRAWIQRIIKYILRHFNALRTQMMFGGFYGFFVSARCFAGVRFTLYLFVPPTTDTFVLLCFAAATNGWRTVFVQIWLQNLLNSCISFTDFVQSTLSRL